VSLFLRPDGIRISVSSITRNVEGFAFTGQVRSRDDRMISVRDVDPSFRGLGHSGIKAIAMLHELAHVLGLMPDDTNNPVMSMANERLSRDKCI
jgi:hypothetical protein